MATWDDREQITELFAQYGRACDTRDWDLLESCFVPDCVVSYAGFGKTHHGYAALEEYLKHALAPLDATQHLFANFVVTVDGDKAWFRCSLQAQHVKHGAEDGSLYAVGATYEVDLVRTPDGWRITKLHLTPIWASGNPAVLEHIEEANAAHRG
jgi:ketosteroid isomerase-like protein